MSQHDGHRRHRKIIAPNGSIASVNKRKCSPCQQDGDSSFLKENGDGDYQAGETMTCSIPVLPEDVWHHIHSLMPLRDAARVACLSHAFLRSWRCYPNLTFNDHVLSPKAHIYESHIIDCIMRNHSGTGVKILKLQSVYTSFDNLNSWLRVAVKPGIEELTFGLFHRFRKEYKFPCSLLSDGVRNSIRYLELYLCTLSPTAELGPLQSLTSLRLWEVRITGDELECLLSNSLALEKLELFECNGILCLRIPCELQRFSRLRISACGRLKLIECKAPNLSSLQLWGKPELSLGEALQMKNLSMYDSNFFCYARIELPSIMPNLDTLYLSSYDEMVKTPMLPTKFLCLKHLTIHLGPGPFPWSFDYSSLISFLDASPSLETLSLDVTNEPMKQELVFRQYSDLRQIAEDQHRYLKNVKITGFSSVKSLVELTCYILKNAVSLESLTLDAHCSSTRRCSDTKNIFGRCRPVGNSLKVKRKALLAIRKFIEDKVPAGVKLTVVEPCTRCHKSS
ncbi:unnamed protein product [Urochloa decumbens]|uniref:At1g61320/AtMIF1 LRR domain-containing protein n=1 Tax=Urochloa decumbens TaxID=240449 RepID=A0ABC9BMM2_9POAL